MKTIPTPDLKSGVTLKPCDMNRIHFAGDSSPLTAKEIYDIVEKKE